MACSPPGSSVHGILQARILEWVAIPFSRVIRSHHQLKGIDVFWIVKDQHLQNFSVFMFWVCSDSTLTYQWNYQGHSQKWSIIPFQGLFPHTATVWLQSNFKMPSVQFSRSGVSNSLQPHGLQHARPPCPSPTPGAHPNSCPLSRWCHPTISSSVVPWLNQHLALY